MHRQFCKSHVSIIGYSGRLLILGAILCYGSAGCVEAADEKMSAVLSDAGKSDSMVGYWVRADDVYAGTIIEISERRAALVGTLIHVSEGLVPYGFRVGDVKLKNFRESKSGEFEIESLVHNVNAFTGQVNEWYDDGVARFSKDEFVWRQTQYEDRLGGEWQRWVRIDETSEHGGNLLRGLGTLSVLRKNWTTAMEYYSRAVERDRTPLNLNDYAWFLATAPNKRHRDPAKAIELASEACKATHYRNASYMDTLAAAYAANGKWDDAVRYQIQACRFGASEDDGYVMRLAYYQEETPFVHGMYREINVQDVMASIGNTAVGSGTED